MDQLVPDVEREMDAIAVRLIVIKMEHPNYDINGMLISLKCHLNRMCILIGAQGGEDGELWKGEK
jgi:hypothetical protein